MGRWCQQTKVKKRTGQGVRRKTELVWEMRHGYWVFLSLARSAYSCCRSLAPCRGRARAVAGQIVFFFQLPISLQQPKVPCKDLDPSDVSGISSPRLIPRLFLFEVGTVPSNRVSAGKSKCLPSRPRCSPSGKHEHLWLQSSPHDNYMSSALMVPLAGRSADSNHVIVINRPKERSYTPKWRCPEALFSRCRYLVTTSYTPTTLVSRRDHWIPLLPHLPDAVCPGHGMERRRTPPKRS